MAEITVIPWNSKWRYCNKHDICFKLNDNPGVYPHCLKCIEEKIINDVCGGDGK